MIIKKVTQVGNPIIRRRSALVQKVRSEGTKRVIKNLIDSTRAHDLVGMAAPQIGENVRIFVTEVRPTKFRKPSQLEGLRVYINPRIVKHSSLMQVGYEGCGSVAKAGLFARVRRSAKVVIVALNEQGQKFEEEASGLLAVIIQHELDHLDGKVFLDRPFETKSLKSADEYLAYCESKLKKRKRSKK